MGEQDFSDFQFIIGELNRFTEMMNKEKFREISKDDALSLIGQFSPKHTHILGREGSRFLHGISKRALENDKTLRFRASLETVKRAIEWHFVNHIIVAKKRLTPQLADMIVGRACQYVQKSKLETTTYYIPCIVADDTDRPSFDVGPVRFQTTDSFFAEKELQLDRYTKSTEQKHIKEEKAIILGKQPRLFPAKDEKWPLLEIRKFSHFFVDRLREYLSGYRWIASTKLKGFDRSIGEKLALTSVETALSILRLFIGAYHADHFRIGGEFRMEAKGVKIFERANGEISISTSGRSESATLGREWLSIVFSERDEKWVHLAGSLIEFLQSGGPIPFLYQRLIDALWWYGEAVSEPRSHAKIIRYANALEVFLGTSSENISSQISIRAAYLCADDVVADTNEWFEKTKRFYDARSALVHGRMSPLHPDVTDFVHAGESITSRVLMEGLGWTLYLSNKDHRMNEREIGACFDELLPQYAFDLAH